MDGYGQAVSMYAYALHPVALDEYRDKDRDGAEDGVVLPL